MNSENPAVAPIFRPYYAALSARSQKRQRRELASLRAFAQAQGVRLGDLLTESSSWAKISAQLVQAYLEDLKAQGYQASSIALQAHTVKRYASLAMEASVLAGSTYEAIHAIPVPPLKSEVISFPLTDEQAQQLLAQPIQSRRGARDALCMALLLRCGLWPKSIVSLRSSDFNLTEKTITFYDYHKRWWRVRRLDSQTLVLVAHYLTQFPLHEALFPRNRGSEARASRWTDRALNLRVQLLGKRIGIPRLLPRDCYRYWQKAFANTTESALLCSWKGKPPLREESVEDEARSSRGTAPLSPAQVMAAHAQMWVEDIQVLFQEMSGLVQHYPLIVHEEQSCRCLLTHMREALKLAESLRDALEPGVTITVVGE